MDTKKMRACAALLPAPGGEVVCGCLDEIERLRSQKMIVLGNGKTVICNARVVEKDTDDEVLIIEATEARPVDAVCDEFVGKPIDTDDPRMILRIVVADHEAGQVLIRALQRVSGDALAAEEKSMCESCTAGRACPEFAVGRNLTADGTLVKCEGYQELELAALKSRSEGRVERVARALFEDEWPEGYNEHTWSELKSVDADRYRRAAVRVLVASDGR